MLADVYGALLTERQLLLLREWADCDTSLSEIAEKYAIARQSAKDSIDAAKKLLAGFEDKLGFADKTARLEAAAKTLSAGDAAAVLRILGKQA